MRAAALLTAALVRCPLCPHVPCPLFHSADRLCSPIPALQVFPREYRRAMDEAAKLKAAQAAEAELLKEVGQ